MQAGSCDPGHGRGALGLGLLGGTPTCGTGGQSSHGAQVRVGFGRVAVLGSFLVKRVLREHEVVGDNYSPSRVCLI